MPKLKPTETEEKNCIVRAYIAKNMELYSMGSAEVATRIGIAKSTFHDKRKRPETFTLRELRKLCVVLKFTNDEKIQIL